MKSYFIKQLLHSHEYAYVTERNGYTYYRNIKDPKDEIKVKDDKHIKCRIKGEI